MGVNVLKSITVTVLPTPVARSGRLRRTVYDVSIVISEKHLFSLPEDLHYLNCAYMSPTPKRVAEAGASGIALKSVPSQIKSQDFFTNSDRVRELFARLVNVADPQRVAIIPAASYGIAVVARNTPLARGQNIVVAHEQFPSNVYAWREASRRQGIGTPDGHAPRWDAACRRVERTTARRDRSRHRHRGVSAGALDRRHTVRSRRDWRTGP